MQQLTRAGMRQIQRFCLKQHARANSQNLPKCIAPVHPGVAEVTYYREAGFEQMAADLMKTPGDRKRLEQ